jgi:hypothetical protein
MTRGVAGWRGASLFCAAAALCGIAQAATVSLAPLLPGRHAQGSGVEASVLKVDDGWRGSGVRHDPVTDPLGRGLPIGSFPGGTGLRGLVAWHTARFAPPPGMIEAAWNGRVAQTGFGDALYDRWYAPQRGAMALPPLFVGDDTGSQDNRTARFSGYVRIAEAGVCHFGVLHDDGFGFTLAGAAGRSMTLDHDGPNPPSRIAFAQDLRRDAGLYGFVPGACERLEVGVVEPAWTQDDRGWSRVPTAHLLTDGDLRRLPEPGELALLAPGPAGLPGSRRAAA